MTSTVHAPDGERLRAVHEAALRREHVRAAALAHAALEAGIQHPLLYNVMALRLEEEGRTSEAEVMLRRGLEGSPTDPGLRNALGLCLLQLERPAEALEQFDVLLVHEARMPFIHASRGAALFALGAYPEAEASYRRALELDPRQGVALSGLANLHASRGAYGTARSLAEQALALLPQHPEAVMSLAVVELGEGDAAGAERRLRSLPGGLARADRAYASRLLGDTLDAQGRHAEAFAAYQTCNLLLQEWQGPRLAGRQRSADYVESLIRYFRAAAPAWKQRLALEPPLPPPACPIFLVGFPRSGSTLLKVTLEGHPDVVGLENHELLLGSVRQFMQQPEDLDGLLRAPPETLAALRESYWALAAAGLGGTPVGAGRLLVDAQPLNVLKLLIIAILFPGAKLVFACRDPRDAIFSCFRHHHPGGAPAQELLNLESAARYYDAVMQLLVAVSGSLPLDICLVRHEDVLTGFSREMKRLCEFLNIQWVPAMGDFALRGDPSRGVPSTSELRHALGTEGIGQWRHYRAHLEPVLPVLAPWVKRFYYEED